MAVWKLSSASATLGSELIDQRFCGGVSQIHEKKIVSVGLFSTFRHPLAFLYSAAIAYYAKTPSLSSSTDFDKVSKDMQPVEEYEK